MTAISVEDLHKRYGTGPRAVQALRGVSLQVERGEVYGLLGRNGAGKTTMVKILLDIVRPSQGRTALLDVSSRETRARREVGYLPEDHRFPDYQTAASALAFHGALAGMDRVATRRRGDELLEMVDLSAARDRKVRGFSKGMKQRLGLAQAMIHAPQLLFLDEPTDGVDPVGRAKIREVLEHMRANGTTIFLNSHLLSEVEQLCDRVGILDGGKLVREGTIDDLTNTALVYRVVTDPLPTAAQVEMISPLVTSIDRLADGTLEIGLSDDDQLDRLVDALRSRDLGIRHLSGKRESLEDVFLHAVDPGGDA